MLAQIRPPPKSSLLGLLYLAMPAQLLLAQALTRTHLSCTLQGLKCRLHFY
jgi:hypothetical protein